MGKLRSYYVISSAYPTSKNKRWSICRTGGYYIGGYALRRDAVAECDRLNAEDASASSH